MGLCWFLLLYRQPCNGLLSGGWVGLCLLSLLKRRSDDDVLRCRWKGLYDMLLERQSRGGFYG